MERYSLVLQDFWRAVELMDGFSPAEIFEIVQCCLALGSDTLEKECLRVRAHQHLHSEAAVEEFLSR